MPSRGTADDERFLRMARAQRLSTVLRGARFAPLPVALEFALLPLMPAPGRTLAASLFGAHLAVALLAAATAWLTRPSALSAHGLAAAERAAVVCAVAAGLGWAAAPVLLAPFLGGELRLALGTMTFGNVALLAMLEPALALAFFVPAFAGTAAGVARTGGVADAACAAFLLGLGSLILFCERRRHRRWLAETVARLAADERTAKLDLLPQHDPDAASPWFWRTDEAGRLRGVSALLAAAAGWSPERLEGKSIERLFLGPLAAMAPSRSAAEIAAAIARHDAFDGDVEHRTDAGRSVWWHMTGTPSRDAAGNLLGYRGIGWNVSAMHDAADRIAHCARHDALTDLLGGEAFRARVAVECGKADTGTRAVLLVNIDGFKEVNRSLGRSSGDVLLKRVAERLVEVAPRSATLARFGADEFAILCAPSNAASAEAFGRSLITTLRAPFTIDDTLVSIDAGVGIALTPAADADAMLRNADLALVRAKSNGRGRCQTFAPDFEQGLAVRRELELDIKMALANGEFAVHYQPLLDPDQARIVGLEALIRWASPKRGNVSPADFIPAAETGGFVIEIGRFVLTQACKAAAGWPDGVRVAVNISPKHLRSPDFIADVTLALKTSGLAPTRLEIEITEGVFLESDSDALANLHALRARGIRIALDDFGTGYSSLNYLTNFPVDKIKIDRSFIRHLRDRHANRAVVDAILDLARKLDLSVTAEGVETAEQALALKIGRCNELQGFLISKAKPGDEVMAMFANVPEELRRKVPALFEGPLAAVVAMRRQTAA